MQRRLCDAYRLLAFRRCNRVEWIDSRFPAFGDRLFAVLSSDEGTVSVVEGQNWTGNIPVPNASCSDRYDE